MSWPTLQNIDLNLLVALDALISEQSVTRAAQRIGVSQPAMSQALARLRTAFDDPLLVRTGRGMAPTTLAESLAAPLHGLLSQLDSLVRERGDFSPATSTRAFHLASLDHFSALHLPGLIGIIRDEAPDVDLVATQLSYDTLASDLERGVVDLGIGVFNDVPAGQMQRHLHDERFVCMVRRGHPALERWGLDAFVSAPHGLLATTGRGPGTVDRCLSAQGLSRRVAVRVPHFLAAGAIAASSDLVFTVAGRLAKYFSQCCDVVLVEPPLSLPTYAVVMRWHRRSHEDPAHRWIRQRICESSP